MTSPYVIRHDGVEQFSLAPSELWPEITSPARFERWWSWLKDLELEPDEVATGSVLTFTIASPLPYKMRCRVHLVRVKDEELIETTVSGDLEGWATLRVEPQGEGSRVSLTWELEPTQRPLRLLTRAARPLILRTKGWAIDVALSTFRRKVEGHQGH